MSLNTNTDNKMTNYGIYKVLTEAEMVATPREELIGMLSEKPSAQDIVDAHYTFVWEKAELKPILEAMTESQIEDVYSAFGCDYEIKRVQVQESEYKSGGWVPTGKTYSVWATYVHTHKTFVDEYSPSTSKKSALISTLLDHTCII